jgi:hypothetical protein
MRYHPVLGRDINLIRVHRWFMAKLLIFRSAHPSRAGALVSQLYRAKPAASARTPD